MHKVKVYDVDLYGKRHDTNKVIEVAVLPELGYYGDICNGSTIIIELFNTFGFNMYARMYRLKAIDNGWNVYYENGAAGGAVTNTTHGVRVNWYLQKGI